MDVSFEISEDWPQIAQFQIRPNLIEEIKATQNEDSSLSKLKDEVLVGNATGFKICDGILKLGDRLCMPDVADLR